MTGNAKGNTNDEFKTCIDCDESFIVTAGERAFLTERGRM